jgi:thiol-disulfide isomerase/thioredoxin
MKKRLNCFFAILVITCFTSCDSKLKQKEIDLQEGIVNLAGKIVNKNGNIHVDNIKIKLMVFDNITGTEIELKTLTDGDGSFYFEIPTTTRMTVAHLNMDQINIYPVITLIQGEENKLEITGMEKEYPTVTFQGKENKLEIIRNKEIEFAAVETNSFPFNSYDIIQCTELSVKLDQCMCNHGFRERHDFTPEEYKKAACSALRCRIDTIVGVDTLLSSFAKKYLINEFKLRFVNATLFYYPEEMKWNYQIYGFSHPEEKLPDFVKPSQPEKPYYSFLKDLELDNPDYLSCSMYFHLLRNILRNDTLNIAPIEDMPVDAWIKDAKGKLAEWVGFDRGLFYDLLASNAYGRQFNSEIRPLSEKQIANIKSYWKNNEIAKILLKKNGEIIKMNAEKTLPVIKETPQTPKELLMDSIIARYRGKVVLVDFWATWCGPCLNAMKEIFPLKAQMKDKEVVFVYLTGETSPEKSWEEKVRGIGGEHYYLTGEEWKYMGEFYEFTGIPCYFLFDKNGKLIKKILGYPGNDEFKKLIDKLL